jgi:hypothetical protein
MTDRELLGKPVKEYRFAKDRVSHDFAFQVPPKYDLSCTVLKKGGLTYLLVVAPLPSAHG